MVRFYLGRPELKEIKWPGDEGTTGQWLSLALDLAGQLDRLLAEAFPPGGKAIRERERPRTSAAATRGLLYPGANRSFSRSAVNTALRLFKLGLPRRES